MQTVSGTTAVVTGAASGIGRAMAARFAAEGMQIVMADVEVDALEAAAAELTGAGATVLAVTTDVADRESVDRLAAATIDRFGVPHVLCNNAGVSGGGPRPIWETTDADWQWVVGVNLMGVVHGIQAFVPAMVDAGHEGHVVNTSSLLGLSTGGGSIYSITKHAVTRLTEGLWYDLQAAGSAVSASVLCPGLIATNIVSSARNRPEHLIDDAARDPAMAAQMDAMQSYFLSAGMDPAEVADMVLDAILTDRFYVLTHPEMILDLVRSRFDAIASDDGLPGERPLGDLISRATDGGDS
ncbi:MAG: SDR family NAD(P)-dependent oxidoreductase [Acidimicrobiales bacterium]